LYFAITYLRLVHRSVLKNILFHYSQSYLSEQYPDVDLSAKHLSLFLRDLGQDRTHIVDWCRLFRQADDCILFDGTDLFSRSEHLELPKFSKIKSGIYDHIFHLMCLFSVGQPMPMYYR